MASCAKHVGDIGPLEPYRPCGRPAKCSVNRPRYGGGLPFWMACEEHGREARNDGLDVEGLDDEDDVIAFMAAKKHRIAKLYERCRMIVALAYRYQAETRGALESTTALGDHRIADCLAQINLYRKAIARTRVMEFSDAETAVMVACANDVG